MKKGNRKKQLLLLTVSTVLVLSIVIGTYLKSQNKTEVPLRTVALQDLQPKRDFYLVGSIEPGKTVEIKLDKNRGKIVEKKVNLNDRVEVGQELFVYSNPEGMMAIKEAEQAVSNRTKLVEQAKLKTTMEWEKYNKTIDQINDTINRINMAAEEDKQELFTRKSELEDQLNQTLLEAKSSENGISDAELELEKIQLELQNTKEKYGTDVVKAEISGVVKDIDENQMNLNTTEKVPEKPFMTIVDTSQLYLKGTVDEFRRDQLKSGQKLRLTDRDGGSQSWTGQVTKISDVRKAGVIDEEQGGNPNLSQFSFEATLDASSDPPVIGMHCFAELLEKKDLITRIPKSFVLSKKGTHYIFLNQKGKARKQKIDTKEDPENKDMLILTSSLEKNTQLIFPNEIIKEGMEVGQNDSAE